ncbi:hypothetical protein NIES4102_38230 [Chondrocystis sp. NIES-4102]|nr:hypothetical protein NIES4102_38230 [Chondrocystis sp. NIES-4102]
MVYPIKLSLKIKQLLLILLAIVSPIILGILIWRYSVNVPFWDQWDTPGKFFLEAAQDNITWEQLMTQHNESRTLFPKLIFWILANLTNWNTKYEMLITFLLACLVSYNIYYLSKATFGNQTKHYLSFILSNLLIFSPIQYETWFWGFQGVTFVSIAAITTSLVVIFSQSSWSTKLITSAVLSAIATFSFANGVICWIIIFPALFLKSIQDRFPKKWVIYFWLLTISMTLSVYLYDYHRPSDLPSVTQIFTRPILAISYYSALLGSPLFPQNLLASQITGFIVILLFIIFSFYILVINKNIEIVERACPWLLIGLYVVFSAVLTTMGRMSIGIEYSLSSRYITFTTYLIVALIYLSGIILTQIPNQIWLKIIIAFLSISLLITYISSFQLGVKISTNFYYQRVYGKTCLLTIDLINDRECLATKIYPYANKLVQQARKVNQIGWLQPGLLKQIDWQTPIQQNQPKYGELANFTANTDGSYLASGWTLPSSSQSSFDTVILAYQTTDQVPYPLAIAELKIDDKDIFKLLINPQQTKLTWETSFSSQTIPSQATSITAWVFNTNNAKAYQIEGVAKLK